MRSVRLLAILLAAALSQACGRPREGNAGAAAASSAELLPAASAPKPVEPPEAREARERLVRKIASEPPWTGASWNPRVLDAMRSVPRHLFAPLLSLGQAYADTPQPIGHEQTISQPSIVAIMTEALELRGSETVLEIGTGSGYQAAVLSLLARQVYTIEILEPLGNSARSRLSELGYRNVEVRVGDGYKGWPEKAPFDRVLLTAAPPEIPKALVEQLADGGILVAPVGEQGGAQRLVRWTKRGAGVEKQDLGAVRFVPMVNPP